MSDNNELVVSQAPAGQLNETKLALALGEMFLVPAQSIINMIRDQIIQVPRGEKPATPYETAYVMSVMQQYRLNPFIKQVHAWRDWQGRMAVMVGYDGWVQYAREQPTYKGISYEFGTIVDSPDGKGKRCWEWIRATVHDAVRGDLQMVPVYLEEWYVKQRKDKPEPWQNQTKHRLHLKAFTSAIREVYGLGGVSDEVDRDVLEAQRPDPTYHTAQKVESMATDLATDFIVGGVLPMSTQPLVDGDVPGPESFPAPSGIDDPNLREEIINAVKESVRGAPVIDAPCGFKGCPSMAVARCGECGDWVCADHLGENGFSCKKHGEAANG